ncbi:hypothetical protein [Azorhizobium caulinodans]|nr:hypothetical protein [Azorhizobium caulinodans]
MASKNPTSKAAAEASSKADDAPKAPQPETSAPETAAAPVSAPEPVTLEETAAPDTPPKVEAAASAEAASSASAPVSPAEAAARDMVVEPDAYEEADAAEPPIPVVRAPRPSPFVPILSGALAGAVVAVAAAWVFTHYVPPPAQGVSGGRLDALEIDVARDRAAATQRIEKIEAALRAQSPAQDLQPIASGLAKATSDIAALRAEQQKLAAALQSGVDAAKAQAGDLRSAVDAAQKKLETLATTTQALDRASASVAVLAVLRDAIVSGRPFATELEAARAVAGPKAATLDPFASAAGRGYGSTAALAKRLSDEGATALAGEASTGPTGSGVVNRLLSGAESLVRVTPPGGTSAAPSEETLQKAVATLQAGDADGALAALATLPEGARQKLQPVVSAIQGRRDAANAASALFQQALAAISGKTP